MEVYVPEVDSEPISPPTVVVVSSVTVDVPAVGPERIVKVPLKPKLSCVTVTVGRLMARVTNSVTVSGAQIVVVLQASAPQMVKKAATK